MRWKGLRKIEKTRAPKLTVSMLSISFWVLHSKQSSNCDKLAIISLKAPRKTKAYIRKRKRSKENESTILWDLWTLKSLALRKRNKVSVGYPWCMFCKHNIPFLVIFSPSYKKIQSCIWHTNTEKLWISPIYTDLLTPQIHTTNNIGSFWI